MSPANRAGIDTLIRLVPDPVVVASMGPLPSATLHETAASFRHECLNTINDRTHGNRCQEINFREPSGSGGDLDVFAGDLAHRRQAALV
jgi:hypothetical protein